MRFSPLSRPVVTGFCLSLATAFLSSSPLHAISVDGTLDSGYGAALSVQNNATGFGDDTTQHTDGTSDGSELDSVSAIIQSGMLYVFLAGNVESNYNPVDLFIDTGNGLGQNTLAANTQSTVSPMNGLKFDTGFAPYFYFTANGGGTGSSGPTFYVDAATLPLGGGGLDQYLGNTNAFTTTGSGKLSGGSATGTNGDDGISFAVNNNNVGGVGGLGNTGASTSGAGVTTGLEYAIPLTLLGSPTGSIRIAAFINGNGQSYLSNQVIGPLPAGTGNLANPATVDFSAIAGNQFVTVVPEPGSVALLCAGAAVLGGWTYRRRQ